MSLSARNLHIIRDWSKALEMIWLMPSQTEFVHQASWISFIQKYKVLYSFIQKYRECLCGNLALWRWQCIRTGGQIYFFFLSFSVFLSLSQVAFLKMVNQWRKMGELHANVHDFYCSQFNRSFQIDLHFLKEINCWLRAKRRKKGEREVVIKVRGRKSGKWRECKKGKGRMCERVSVQGGRK